MKTDRSLGFLKSSRKCYDLELASVSKEVQTPEAKLHSDMKQPFLKCRHIVALVGLFYYVYVSGVRLNMSVNIVAMVNHSAVAQRAKVKSDSCPLLMPNSTQKENIEINEDGEFQWSPDIQGYILSSYGLCYVIIQIPTGILVQRYGCKWFLFMSVFVSSVLTFLMPVFAWISAESIIALQCIRGLSVGITLPASSVLVAKWFTRSERGHIFAFIMSGGPLGCVFSGLLSGFLCASSGKWPSSFYAIGASGVVILILLLFCVYESPGVHPRITKAELDFILEDQEATVTKRDPIIPWCKIFTSVPVYALFYSTFCQGWIHAQFLMVHTIFLGSILHYSIAKNGMFTALLFFLQFVFANIGTMFVSLIVRKRIATLTFARKLMNFMSCLGFSASMLGIYLSGCNRTLSVILAILSAGFAGIGTAGGIVTVPEMAPSFAGVLNGFTSLLYSLPYVILPLLIGFLTKEQQTIEQWNKAFFISIAVVMLSGIFYSIFGSAEVQPWNFVEEEKEEEKTKSNL